MLETSPQPWEQPPTAVASFFQACKTWLSEWSQVISLVLAIVGVGLTLVGWWQFQAQVSAPAQETSFIATVVPTAAVSSLVSSPAAAISSPASLRAHIAGAVRKPGVYELPASSVLQDLVIKAGGLSGLVWQDYLDAHINLAEPLNPNQKVWIPTINQQTVLAPIEKAETFNLVSNPTSPVATGSSLISINTASVAELDMLAGIGQKRAEDIVSNRPYAAIEELTTKAKVPQSIVNELGNQLSL